MYVCYNHNSQLIGFNFCCHSVLLSVLIYCQFFQFLVWNFAFAFALFCFLSVVFGSIELMAFDFLWRFGCKQIEMTYLKLQADQNHSFKITNMLLPRNPPQPQHWYFILNFIFLFTFCPFWRQLCFQFKIIIIIIIKKKGFVSPTVYWRWQ